MINLLPKLKIVLVITLAVFMLGCSGISEQEAKSIATDYIEANLGPVTDFDLKTWKCKYGWEVEVHPTKATSKKYLPMKFFPVFIEVSDKGEIISVR